MLCLYQLQKVAQEPTFLQAMIGDQHLMLQQMDLLMAHTLGHQDPAAAMGGAMVIQPRMAMQVQAQTLVAVRRQIGCHLLHHKAVHHRIDTKWLVV